MEFLLLNKKPVRVEEYPRMFGGTELRVFNVCNEQEAEEAAILWTIAKNNDYRIFEGPTETVNPKNQDETLYFHIGLDYCFPN